MEHTELARMGGRARAANMDAAERSEAARKAVNKRWSDVRAKAALLKARKGRRGRKAAV
jgi:hypothetical protein